MLSAGMAANRVWLSLVLLSLPLGGWSQTGTSDWLLRAATYQRHLEDDVPVDQLTWVGTHNSFSWDGAPATHNPAEVVPNQEYSITNQLSCLEVRSIEIDVHFIEELGSNSSAARVCHVGNDAAQSIYDVCVSYGWDLCKGCGVENFGRNGTGCRAQSPTFNETLEEVAAWSNAPANAGEVLMVKLESYLGSHAELASTLVTEKWGTPAVFSPADWASFTSNGGTAWPSTAQLRAMGKRVFFVSLEPSSLIFSYKASPTLEQMTSPGEFEALVPPSCGNLTGEPTPSFAKLQGDLTVELLTYGTISLYHTQPVTSDRLTTELVQPAMVCGMSPAFDRMNTSYLASTVWSWAEDHPQSSSPGQCAVAWSQDGRWRDEACAGGSAYRHACRSDDRQTWALSDTAGPFTGAACPPATPNFGGPRSAYENSLLLQSMGAAGETRLWVNHTSTSDPADSGATACWSRESLEAGCLPGSWDGGRCAALLPKVLEGTGQCAALSAVLPWEDAGYVVPGYSPNAVVRDLHGWDRVAGGTNWGGSNIKYTKQLLWTLAPFICLAVVCGLMLLPLLYFGASREVHGGGMCGCCDGVKRADTQRSILPWVFFISLLLVAVGGCVTVWGIRQTDADFMNVQDNVDTMASAMILAHEDVQQLAADITSVGSDLTTVMQCQAFQAPLDVTADSMTRSTGELEDFVSMDLGHLGLQIQKRQREIRRTQPARKGAAYSLGVLILLIAAVYAWMAAYSLGLPWKPRSAKRVDSCASCACLLVPVVMAIVALSWVGAGVATVTDLFISDFCIDPRENLMNLFNADQQDLVRYYIFCDAGNGNFVDKFATGYSYALGAQAMVLGIDDASFAAACPSQAASKRALQTGLTNVINLGDSVGALLRCSTLNRMYTAGVETAICRDASRHIVVIMAGLILVAIFLFAAAIMFRLLMSQKVNTLQRQEIMPDEDHKEECGNRGSMSASAGAHLRPLVRVVDRRGVELVPAQRKEETQSPIHNPWWDDRERSRTTTRATPEATTPM